MRFPGQDPEPEKEYLSAEVFQSLLGMLRDSLKATDLEFESLVRQCQNIVWDSDVCESQEVTDLLRDLVLDVEYYVRNPEHRGEDSSYIDEVEAKNRIRACLNGIEELRRETTD